MCAKYRVVSNLPGDPVVLHKGGILPFKKMLTFDSIIFIIQSGWISKEYVLHSTPTFTHYYWGNIWSLCTCFASYILVIAFWPESRMRYISPPPSFLKYSRGTILLLVSAKISPTHSWKCGNLFGKALSQTCNRINSALTFSPHTHSSRFAKSDLANISNWIVKAFFPVRRS